MSLDYRTRKTGINRRHDYNKKVPNIWFEELWKHKTDILVLSLLSE